MTDKEKTLQAAELNDEALDKVAGGVVRKGSTHISGLKYTIQQYKKADVIVQGDGIKAPYTFHYHGKSISQEEANKIVANYGRPGTIL